MRRALACLLMIAALATPAGAQVRAKPTTVVPRAVTSQPTPTQTANPVLPVLLPFAANRQGRDPGQCRAACAKAYYFCGATGDDPGCGGQWAQCKSRCTATYTRPGG
ncbi:hypothetical protein [Caulobacter sp. DWR2-3-1b2]|uniref:hypothetical protein n=1 Tax=unclassified Caulobacter TaxID=2648921 RepID=UPI0019933124|nr:hypothetical protein [Caulobacter sp.]